MIAMTSKKGKFVRLTANFELDTETATYNVQCGSVIFEFTEFAPAARVYKTLSKRIDGETFTNICLDNLVKGAIALGYKVEGAQ